MTAAKINEMLSASRKSYFLPKHTITISANFFHYCPQFTCSGAYTADEMHLSSIDNPRSKFQTITNAETKKENLLNL